MSVVIETTLGDITVDLYLDQRPVTCLNFLKLCKMKYYNYNLFHTIRSDFIAQTGDPTGEGTGGESIWGVLEGPQKRFFSGEKMPKIRHTGAGLLSMVCTDEMMVGSQFFFTLAPDLDSLDGVHCVIGEVTEGQEVLTKLNEVICDETNRPYRDVRITHTVVLEDPFNDPPGLRAPSRSPSPNPERLKGGRIAPDEEIDETQGKSMEEVQEMIEEKEAKARATILEIVGDLPDADIAPPENVLFVCKLNPVTTDDDLEIIFSRFGKIVSCEVIKDKKTGNSLQYAFIEFDNKKSCEDAYFKMDNVLIDDRRIHVDFSQSVSKMRYLGKGRGVQYLNNEVITNPEIRKRGDTSRQNYNDRKKCDKKERDDTSRRPNQDKRNYEDEKDIKSRRDDRRQYDQERDEEYRNRKNYRRKNEEENDRSKKHQNDREREQLSRRHNDREKDDSSRRNNHDQRLDRERNSRRERSDVKSSKNERDHRHDRDKKKNESRSRSRSRNHSTERLPKNGDSRDRRNVEIERHDRNHKQHTKKREISPRRDRHERTPKQQEKAVSEDRIKGSRKCSIEKKNKASEKEERKKVKQNEHKSKDRNENNRKEKHKDSRTPSPDDKKKSNRKNKSKASSKKNVSKRKHKKSTSSDSDSDSSSSSSNSSSSSDSDRKKSKTRRRKRKHSSSSSSDSSSSNSSSSDSSSDSSSSSSDSEPRKKRVKKNKNKSSKNSKK